MLWDVEGADEKTGANVRLQLEAGNHQDAIVLARSRGIFISSINQVQSAQVLSYPTVNIRQDTINPSLWIGLIGLIAWILPIVGIPLSITGLVIGIKGPRSATVSSSIIGIILNIIGLILGVINSAIGAYKGATGQLHF